MDFTTEMGTISSSVTPSNAVQNPGIAGTLSGVTDLFSAGMKGSASYAASGAKPKGADEELTRFQNKLVGLSQASATGSIKSSDAVAQATRALAESSSANPFMQEEYRKLYKEIMSTQGIGDRIVEGSDQEQLDKQLAIKKAEQEVAADGEAKKAGFKNWQEAAQHAANQRIITDSVAKNTLALSNANVRDIPLDRATKETSLASAKLSLEAAQDQRKFTLAAREFSSTGMRVAATSFDSTVDNVDLTNPNQVGVAIESVNKLYEQTQREIAPLAEGDPKLFAYLNTQLDTMKDNSINYLKGTATKEAYKEFSTSIKDEASYELLDENKDIARLAAMTQELGPEAATLVATKAAVGDLLVSQLEMYNRKETSNVPPVLFPTAQEKPEADSFFRRIESMAKEGFGNGVQYFKDANGKQVAKQLTAKQMDYSKQQASQIVNESLKAMAANEVIQYDMARYASSAKFFASDAFAQIKAYGKLSPEEVGKVNQMLKMDYVDKLDPVIKQQMNKIIDNAKASGTIKMEADVADPGKYVLSKFDMVVDENSGLVMFRPKSGNESDMRKLRGGSVLLSEVGKVFQQVVRLQAHFSKDVKNYKGAFEELQPALEQMMVQYDVSAKQTEGE